MIERSGPPQHRAATDRDEEEHHRRPGDGARERSVVVAEQIPDNEVPHTSDDDRDEEGETGESQRTPEADEWPRSSPNPEFGRRFACVLGHVRSDDREGGASSQFAFPGVVSRPVELQTDPNPVAPGTAPLHRRSSPVPASFRDGFIRIPQRRVSGRGRAPSASGSRQRTVNTTRGRSPRPPPVG